MRTAIVLLFLVISAAAIAADSNDIERGLLGVKWGTRLQDVPFLMKLHKAEKGTVEYYCKPDEVRTFQQFEIGHVVYGFHNKQFFAAYLDLESPEVFNAVKKHATEVYGSARVSYLADETVYVWKKGVVKIKLKSSEKGSKWKLAFYYLPLSSDVNEEQTEKGHSRSVRLLPIEKGKKPPAFPILEF